MEETSTSRPDLALKPSPLNTDLDRECNPSLLDVEVENPTLSHCGGIEEQNEETVDREFPRKRRNVINTPSRPSQTRSEEHGVKQVEISSRIDFNLPGIQPRRLLPKYTSRDPRTSGKDTTPIERAGETLR